MASPKLGIASGFALALLCPLYAIALAGGLYRLASPEQPIQQPWFACMELLILAIAPLVVAFMVALHAWAPDKHGPISLLGIVFMSMCAVVTCGVHFVILTLSREPAFSALPWAPVVFYFDGRPSPMRWTFWLGTSFSRSPRYARRSQCRVRGSPKWRDHYFLAARHSPSRDWPACRWTI